MLNTLQFLIRIMRSIIPFLVIGYAIFLFLNNQLMEGLVALILFELIEMNSKPTTIVMVGGDHDVTDRGIQTQPPPKAGRGSAFDNDTLDHKRVLCNECKTYIYGPPGDVSYCECNPRKMPWDDSGCLMCNDGKKIQPGCECIKCGRVA